MELNTKDPKATREASTESKVDVKSAPPHHVLDTPFNGALQPSESVLKPPAADKSDILDQIPLNKLEDEVLPPPKRALPRQRLIGLSLLVVGCLAALMLGVRIEADKTHTQDVSLVSASQRFKSQTVSLPTLGRQLHGSTFSSLGTLTVNGNLKATSGLTLGAPLTVANGGSGVGTLPTNSVLTGNGTNALAGVVAGSADLCLVSTAGAPTFQACPGSGGVGSLNALNGALTIAGVSAGSVSSAGNTVTINDATSAVNGLASFNSTNFTVSGGAVNTVQGIATTSTPQFAGLNLTNALTVSNGGTGLTTLTADELLLANTTSSIGQLTNGASGQCLVSNGASSAPSFQACTGAGGVASLDSLNGSITITNSSGSAGTITINNAKADGTTKGIAAFNSTNFSDNGSGVINTVQGIATISTPQFAGLNLTNALTVGNGGTGATTAAGARTDLGAAASGANSDITSLSGLTTALSVSQGGTGLTALTVNELLYASSASGIGQLSYGTSNQCLLSNGSGNAPTWQTCPGANGVTSLDGLTGSITLANSSGSAGTVTINNAAADGSTKGLAAFNSTNFTAASGVINTVQGIATTSSPTFANLTVSTTLNANTITPSSALAIGATSQAFTLQGSGSSVITATGGSDTTTIGFTGVATGNVTYQFDRGATAGTYTICTTVGNCAGTGGGITGSGTANRLAVFTGSGTIGSSDITDNSGTSVSIASGVALSTQGSAQFENANNSTTAFQVQNASASDILDVDTTDGRIGIGTNAPDQALNIYNGNEEVDYGGIKLVGIAPPSAPTVAVGSGGVLNGTYYYCVVFVTTNGQTQCGTVSASVAPASQEVNLTNIPTGTSGVVTARKLYRTKAGQTGPYYLVTSINDDTTTSFTDNDADSGLTVTVSAYNTVTYISNPQGQSNAEAFGLNATTSGNNSTAVGNDALSTSSNAVAIGYLASAYYESTVVGENATALSGNGTAIGQSSNAAYLGVAVGDSAKANGNYNVAIGHAASSGVGTDSGSIAIGDSATNNASDQLVIGGSTSSNAYIQNAYIGSGVTDATPQSVTINATGGSGTNIGGASISLAGGIGTGTGNGGNINFEIAKPSATSGSSANSLSQVLGISGVNGAATFENASDSTTAFQIQKANGVPIFVADTTDLIVTVEGTANSYVTMTLNNAHLSSTQTNPPTAGTPANCGTSPTASVSSGSTDATGSFTVHAGTGSPTTCDTTITFNRAYASTPKTVILTPTTVIGSATAPIAASVSGVSSSTFTVQIAPTNASSGAVYSYYYLVIQ